MSNAFTRAITQNLITPSRLEQGRLDKRPDAPFAMLAEFKGLEGMITHSLKKPELLTVKSPMGQTLLKPTATKRPFQDQELIQKLLKFKDRIPLSARVLRPDSKTSS